MEWKNEVDLKWDNLEEDQEYTVNGKLSQLFWLDAESNIESKKLLLLYNFIH